MRHGLALALLAVLPARAGSILFDQPVTMVGDTDVLTAGTLVYAFTESNVATTVNGVPFAAGSSVSSLGSGSITMSGFNSISSTSYGSSIVAPFNLLSASYKDVVKGAAWIDGSNSATVTLKNLTIGRTYAVQLWAQDARAGGSRTETVTGVNQVLVNSNVTNAEGGLGQHAKGWFTADATTQSFTLGASSMVRFNAIQVRDVTGIGSWTGTGGVTWDQSSTANFNNNGPTAPLSAVPYDTVRNMLVPGVFADTYRANGASVTVATSDVTIASGGVAGGEIHFRNTPAKPYTITSSDGFGLTGAAEVLVNGGGAVTFAGDHSYTGGTGIYSGSLTFKGKVPGGPIINATTLTFDSTAHQSYPGVISGSGALVKSGTGTLTLTGVNTYTGTTAVNAGTIKIGDATSGSLGVTNISIASGATVEFGPSALIDSTRTFSGAGQVIFHGSNTGAPVGSVSSFTCPSLNSAFSGTITVDNARLITSSASPSGGTGTLVTTGNSQIYVQSSLAGKAIIQGTGWGGSEGNLGAIRLWASAAMSTAVTLAGDSRIGIDGGIATISGPITESGGSRSLELVPTGVSMTLTHSSAGSYTGGTTIGVRADGVPTVNLVRSTVTLSYGVADSSKFSDTAPLTLRGKLALTLVNGTHAEVVGSTLLDQGSDVVLNRTSGSDILDLGVITRGTGAMLNVALGSIAKTANVPVSGNLGSWLTVGGTALATTDSSGFIVPVTYTDVPTVSGTITTGMDQVRISSGVAGSLAMGPEAMIDVNSITRATAGLATIDTAGKILRLAATGAVVSGAGSGGITFGTAADSGILTAGGAVDTPGTLGFNTLAGNVTVNATITDNGAGAVSVSKTGATELILSGANTYTGGTVLSGGTVRPNHDSAFGTGAVVIAWDTILGGLSGGHSATTLANPIDLNSKAALTLSTSLANFTFTGPITGLGNLIVTGTGTASIASADSHTGTTTVNGGILRIAPGGSISATPAITINNAAGSGFTNLGTLAIAGPVTINAGSATDGSVFTNGDAAGTTPGSVTASGITLDGLTPSGIAKGGTYVQNPGSTTNVGAGVITVTGSSSFTGAASGSTFTNAGGGVTAAFLSLNPSASRTNRKGGTYLQTAGTTEISDTVALNGDDATLSLSGGVLSSPRLSIFGSTTVSGSATLNVADSVSVGSGNTATDAGAIIQTGGIVNFTTSTPDGISIGFSSPGYYTLSGGTWNVPGCPTRIGGGGNGTLTISGGTANLKGLVMGSTTQAATLNLTGGRLNLGSGSLTTAGTGTIATTFGAGTLGVSSDLNYAPAITLSSTGVGMTFDTSDYGDGTTAHSISLSGVIGGAGALKKVGAGTLTLSGANTYTGFTSVAGGTLRLMSSTGSATGTGAVTVGAQATLAGTANVTGSVSVTAGGTIAPGDSGIGTLQTGSLSIAGTYSCAIQGAASDLLAVTGNLTLSGTLDLTTVNPVGNLVIATYTGTRTGTFASVTGLPPGYGLNYNVAAKRVEVAITDPYLAWATAAGVDPGAGARTLDPDNDGVANFAEFALDGNPQSGARNAKIVSGIATVGFQKVMTLTLPVRAGVSFSTSGNELTATSSPITYRIQGGSSPGGTDIAVSEITGTSATTLQNSLNLPAVSTGWTYRSFRLGTTVTQASKGFLRAKVTE